MWRCVHHGECMGVWVFLLVFDKGDYMCCVRISPCGAAGAL